MGYRMRLPFHLFSLELDPDHTFYQPLSDYNTLRVGQPLPKIYREYQKSFQQLLRARGARALLTEFRDGRFFRESLTYTVPQAPDGFSFPQLQIDFDIYLQERSDDWWGILPVLGIEAYAKSREKLVDRLRETVQIDFARHRRLRSLKHLIEIAWFTNTDLKRFPIELEVPEPGDLIPDDQEEEQLLPKMATLLEPTQQMAYDLQEEKQQARQILGGHFTRNLLLVGASGTGKTALVYELARTSQRPPLNLEIWETTASAMIKALIGEQSWEYNIGELVRELTGTRRVLYVRNLMDLFEVGKYEGNEVSIGEFLQPFLMRGEIQMIAECNEREFSAIELKNPAYVNCFQQVRLEEPKEPVLVDIITRKIQALALQQGVQVHLSAIQEAIRLSRRFSPYSGMPGRPIRFLESLVLGKSSTEAPAAIDRKYVIQYFCQESGMPRFMVDPAIPMDPEQVKTSFNEQLFSQEEAVHSVVDALAAVKTALTRTGKPIASFLFVGPTGVGKTELAKILTQFMFGHRDRMLRFDMSEYSTPMSVMRLTGMHSGEDGLLTGAVRRQPFSVLLFDEMEKADDSFYDLLLQILSEGRLTDSRGQLANFCSTIIIMTSNIGAQRRSQSQVKVGRRDDRPEEAAYYEQAVQQYFRPELYNRMDRIIPFGALDADTVRFVVDREIDILRKREGLRFRNIQLEITPQVLDHLARTGYHPAYGARYLQRAIRDQLIRPLSEILNRHEYEDRLQLKIDMSAERIAIGADADPLALDLLLEALQIQSNADYAAGLRRSIQAFRSGYYLTVLQQEIDNMEAQQQEQGPAFWENRKEVERYMSFTQLRDRCIVLHQGIEHLERQTSLMVLEHEPYRPAVEDEISAWEEAYFELRRQLYLSLNPENNRCFFHIYGESPNRAAELYFALFEAAGFSFTATALYYRHAQYQRYQQYHTAEEAQAAGTLPYYRKTISYRQPDFRPDQTDDILVGIECTVFGPGAFLWLEPEEGGQSWQPDPDSREKKVRISVHKDFSPAPDDIHRRDFVRKPEIRRRIHPAGLTDARYTLPGELTLADFPKWLQQNLEEQFHHTIQLRVQ